MASYQLPVIDVSVLTPLLQLFRSTSDGIHDETAVLAIIAADRSMFDATAQALHLAFRQYGFAYISGHSLPSATTSAELDHTSRNFFHLPDSVKNDIGMKQGGSAWRGYFPLGGELTSGKPDLKEGIYFGLERDAVSVEQQPDPKQRVLIGPNLFPPESELPQFRPMVLSYMSDCQALGHGLLLLVALSLGLDPLYFVKTLCQDALCLFRIFHYPAASQIADPALQSLSGELWGVGEHTDYGLLTLLKQDAVGGLEVMHVDGTWMPAPPIDGTFVVNIGDIMEYLTHGYFTSTPHRVRNTSKESMRLSFPFFFDPSLDALMQPIPLTDAQKEEAQSIVSALRANQGKRGRWDNRQAVSVGVAEGSTYRDYILQKIGKVFPELAQSQF